MRRIYAVRNRDQRVVLDCGKNPPTCFAWFASPRGRHPSRLTLAFHHHQISRVLDLELTLRLSLMAVLIRRVLNSTTAST